MANCEMLRRCFSDRKLYQAFLQQYGIVLSIRNTCGSRSGILCWEVHDQLKACLLVKAYQNDARPTKPLLLILNKRKKE